MIRENESPNTKIKLFLILLVLATTLMGVGYATINNVVIGLGGQVLVKAPDTIFISNVTVANATNGANTANQQIVNYLNTTLNSITVLSPTNNESTVSYNVTVKNNSRDNYVFDDAIYSASFYDNSNIDYYLTGISNGDIVDAGDSINFTITFKYKDSYKLTAQPYNNNLNSYINFKFDVEEATPTRIISYNGLTDSSGLPTTVTNGETATINFGTAKVGVISIIMNSVALSSSNYTFANNILTIPNVNGNITINMAEIEDIEFPIYNAEPTVTNPNITEDNQIKIGDLLTTHLHGKNFGEKSITKIVNHITYTSTTGSSQSLTVEIKVNGQTVPNSSQTVSFSGKQDHTILDLTFNNLAIGPDDEFEFTYTTKKLTNGNIDIISYQLDLTYAN